MVKNGLTSLTTLWIFSNPLKAKSKSSIMILSLWNAIFDLLTEIWRIWSIWIAIIWSENVGVSKINFQTGKYNWIVLQHQLGIVLLVLWRHHKAQYPKAEFSIIIRSTLASNLTPLDRLLLISESISLIHDRPLSQDFNQRQTQV